MTDMPMTNPGQWGKNKPRNLQEALAGVRTSLKMVDGAKKPSGAVGAHVATIEEAAEGLLEVINDRTSGQTVRDRVAQFDDGTTAARKAVNAEIGRGQHVRRPSGCAPRHYRQPPRARAEPLTTEVTTT